MNAKIESILRKRTFNMFNDIWYSDIVKEIISKGKDFKGYVYFVSNGMSKNIKIGKSTTLNNRLDSFRTTFGEGVYLWGFIYVENHAQIESELHNKFKDNNIRNEWFSLQLEDFNTLDNELDFIKVHGFWDKDSQIIDGIAFNIKTVKSNYNDNGNTFFNFIKSLEPNKMHYNSDFRKGLYKYSNEYNEWSHKKIHMQIKEWSIFNNIPVTFKKDNKGRGFIINK